MTKTNKDAVNVFDENGDWFITVDGLKLILASAVLKQERAAEDCMNMIVKVDGDGVMNFTEFKQMVKGGRFAALI
ncbi:calmodulin-like protein 3 [Olea europaea var. sylvestris]|uniref:calmodulin-like protein 3 n=1 Tax=Olea europaea var. sylvestris TaxID=158386 RepID=UPI000C1CDBBB|nr:calmodulin-like protein 3 [Olea europaea var. sylvestris]